MKIDTCIIVKNEEKTIKKLIEQFLVFSNEIHITDTGSTDNTIKIIEDFSKKYSFMHLFSISLKVLQKLNITPIMTCSH